MAQDADLDLVLISPNQEPPVAKILDYGKYKYELAKKAKEAKNNIMEEVFHIKKEIEQLNETESTNSLSNYGKRFTMQTGNIKNLLKNLGMNDQREENGIEYMRKLGLRIGYDLRGIYGKRSFKRNCYPAQYPQV